MNEKEKMLNGLLYDANYDKLLFEERIKCKSLCYKYNNLPPEKTEERKALLKQRMHSDLLMNALPAMSDNEILHW